MIPPSHCPPDFVTIARARAELAARDPALAAVDSLLPPPAWRMLPTGFAGLLRLIIGQQVSTTSADAVWARLEGLTGVVLPSSVAALDDAAFRAAGFSGQKTAYARALAAACLDGGFDADALRALDDGAAETALVALKGVGRWTAQTYLMIGEGRMDAFPAGDIAVQEAVRWIDGLAARPDEAQVTARAERWRPYRALAAHWLWAYYLAVKAGEIAHPRASRPQAPGPQTS